MSQSPRQPRIAVIGGGVPSATAIAGLRAPGFDGRITLASAANTLPYERPPLSKEFLRGEDGGGRPRVLPGLARDDVCYLRTVADAAAPRDRIGAAGHVAVLGGGFIGCEVAASASQLGKRATIIEALPTLLHRTLGTELGEGDRVRAVISLNRPKDVLDVRRLITRDHHATAGQLQDEPVPLKRLAAPRPATTAAAAD